MDMDDEEFPPLLVDTKNGTRAPEDGRRNRVPITIVTGYLGAGKTTLLNYILSEQHGKRIAVILNEFGDSSDIEKALTINQDGEQVQEWLEVGNGCICCSVKDSGVNAIESLMEKSGTFDYILLETTGLADPGNLAPIFWVDEGLGSTIYLDGIVTLVDAKNILRTLDEPAKDDILQDDHHHERLLTTAHLQISHADVIVVNKADLVSPKELNAVRERVQGINGLAKVHVTQRGHVPNLDEFLLDLHAYDDVGDLNPAAKGHSHLDPTISTVNIIVPQLKRDHLSRLDAWLRSLLWDAKLPSVGIADSSTRQEEPQSFEVYRLKARIPLDDGSVKIVQGVREIFEISDAPEDRKEAGKGPPWTGQGKLVFIGRNIAGIALEASYTGVINSS